MGIKWKKSEKELLGKLFTERRSLENIQITGRSVKCIRRQAIKMGLVPSQRNPPPSTQELQKLRQLRAEGLSTSQIAMFGLGGPERTANAVQKYLAKLNLMDKNRSQSAKNKKIWRSGEREAFDNFLRQNSTSLAQEQIAQMFGVKQATVIYRQKILGVKTSLKQTLEIPFIKEKLKKAIQKRRQKAIYKFAHNIAEHKKKLKKLAEKLRVKDEDRLLQERCCKVCGTVWPKHPKFFHHCIKSISVGTAWHFSNTCVLCTAEQRHQKKLAKYHQDCSQHQK